MVGKTYERIVLMQERLQKIISQAGVASRRAAEKMIAEGRVKVDGKVVTELGCKVDPATADIRIVILSALNSNEDIVKGFNMGANDFITKPIILEKLTSCVVTQLQLVELAGK